MTKKTRMRKKENDENNIFYWTIIKDLKNNGEKVAFVKSSIILDLFKNKTNKGVKMMKKAFCYLM